MTTRFPEIQMLLPHRGDMALLSSVRHFAPPCMEVTAAIDAQGLLAQADGNLPVWIGIELMAQAAAAYIGLLAQQEGHPPPQVGYLLGTRKFTANVNAFEKNSAMTVVTEMIYRDDSGLGAFKCQIVAGEAVIANATINVFEPPLQPTEN